MEFRYNEIIIWLIPGLYFLCLICLFVLLPFTDESDVAAYLNAIKEIPDGLVTSAGLFFIPFVSFVIGYLINYIASQTEFWCYKSNILNRPSKIILSGESNRYKLSDLDILRQKLGYPSQRELTNDIANDLLIKAKQNINISEFDTYYFKSVFGRNLLCAQVIVVAGIIFDWIYFCNLELTGLICFVLLVILFFASWRRNSKIYVKNIFSAYLKDAKS